MGEIKYLSDSFQETNKSTKPMKNLIIIISVIFGISFTAKAQYIFTISEMQKLISCKDKESADEILIPHQYVFEKTEDITEYMRYKYRSSEKKVAVLYFYVSKKGKMNMINHYTSKKSDFNKNIVEELSKLGFNSKNSSDSEQSFSLIKDNITWTSTTAVEIVNGQNFYRFTLSGYKMAVVLKEGDDVGNLKIFDQYDYPVYLNQFKGKVLYIDLWASWCGPCREAMPQSKSMYNALTPVERKKIVFLFINSDDDQDKWLNAIKTFGLQYGQHYKCGLEIESNTYLAFDTKLIPHYILVNADGKIINLNAFRPSKEALQEIRSVLKQ